MNHCLNDVRPSKCMFLFASIYKGNKSVLLQNDTNRGVSSFFAKCFNYLCLKSFYGSEQNEVVSLLCSTNLTNGKNWQEENNLVMCGLHSLAFCITLSVHYIIILSFQNLLKLVFILQILISLTNIKCLIR